jgi:hypothetical protein
MKKIGIALFILIFLPTVLAFSLDVKKTSSNEVLIYDLDKPLTVDLKITNNGVSDNIEFYNLIGFRILPGGTEPIASGETKDFKLKISPVGEFKYRGFYTFEYYIKGRDAEIKDTLTFQIIDLKDAFEVGTEEINPESNLLKIYLYNKVNFEFGTIKAKFSSPFFNIEKEFELAGNEKKTFEIQLNKEDFKKLMAGFYTVKAEISVDDKKTEVEGMIKFVEKNILTTTKKDYGLVVYTKIIEKKNEGNVIEKTDTVIQKSIISRLFTSFSPEPDVVDRKGPTIYYTWNREVKPGEVLEIKVKTNWLFPFIIILFIVVIVILVKQVEKNDLVLKKKVNFVNAKGGEFALKVSVFITARKFIEKINIIDRLPPLVKVYEHFGGNAPKMNERLRRMEWDFNKLEAGETRVLSYLVYSKVGVLGKFALPATTAIYEKDGKIHESRSNRAFFVAEQRSKEFEGE